MIRRWWRALTRRREWARRPSGDWCATCLVDLCNGDAWVRTTGHQAGDDGEGGTFLSQTWCPRHRPGDAHPLQPPR